MRRRRLSRNRWPNPSRNPASPASSPQPIAEPELEPEPEPEPVIASVEPEPVAAPEPVPAVVSVEPEPVAAPEPAPMPAAEAPEEDAVSEFFSSLFGSDEGAPPPAQPEPVVEPEPAPAVVSVEPEPMAEPEPEPEPVIASVEPEPVAAPEPLLAVVGVEPEPVAAPEPLLAVVSVEPEPIAAPEPAPMPAAEAPEQDAVSEFFSSLFGSDEGAPPPAQPEPVAEPEPEPEPVIARVEPEPVAAPEPEPIVASVEPEPVAAPEPAPMPAAEAPEEDAVSEFFSSLFGSDESAPPPAVAETDVAAAETGPAAVDEEVAPALPAPETVAAVVVAHPEVPEPTRELRFGPSLGLGGALPEGAGDTKCVTKQHGAVNVCISEDDWPVEIEPVFRISSVIYQGSKVIVRYVDGRATRYFANFPTGAYDRVVDHFRGVYGAPQLLWDRKATLSGGGMLVDNPVTVWRKTYSATGTIVYLEVRRHDDVRRDFADGRMGAVRLYIDGTDSVFAGMSTGNFLLLR